MNKQRAMLAAEAIRTTPRSPNMIVCVTDRQTSFLESASGATFTTVSRFSENEKRTKKTIAASNSRKILPKAYMKSG